MSTWTIDLDASDEDEAAEGVAAINYAILDGTADSVVDDIGHDLIRVTGTFAAVLEATWMWMFGSDEGGHADAAEHVMELGTKIN